MKFLDKKLILFDLDGTLIDSVPDLSLAVNHMLSTLGKSEFEEETIRHWVGNGAKTLVERALSGCEKIDKHLDPSYGEKALDIFLTFYAHNLSRTTYAYPHVVTTLSTLKNSGFTLAIITNKPYRFIAPILKELEMDMLFDYCIGGDSLQEKKPHPLPLMHVCETLNIAKEQTVMIGDSKNDILAAQKAEISSIAVTYGYNYNEEISTYGPDRIVDNFADILALFDIKK